jgi:predicted unusual protein kinase regulating ubiquinone biosynthesis (AarF/ABC1/UbiB family)
VSTLVSLRAYWRFVVVIRQFLPLIISYTRDRRRFIFFGGGREVSAETRVRRAEHLLDTLLTLGPTFIKLGQLLSTRPDILPPEYVEVLSRLQDEVPPASWAEARTVLEEELGPVSEQFEEFDTDAISGASLGQVYRARIDGQQVAVKVRRPGIDTLVNADLKVIRWTLPVLVRFVGEGRAFSLRNLADEFAETIREEMDYEREGRMLREIGGNLENTEGVRVPDLVATHSGPKVLTMEYVGGTKISDVAELDRRGIDRLALATTLQEAYLQMIVEDGVFHADPHPGNMAVQDDGTIVFYDFGMSDSVAPYIQDSIVDFYIAVANQDIDGILDTLVAMGTLSPTADRETMGDVMELAIQDARGEDIDQYRVNRILSQVEDTIYEFPFRLPRDLALVLRVATVVEGVCVTLDEDFDFVSVATDYLAEQGYREESARQLFEEVGDQFREAATASVRIPPKLDSVLSRADRGNLSVKAELRDPNDLFDRLARRVVYGIVLAASIIAAALLYPDAALVSAVPTGLGIVTLLLLYRSLRSSGGFRAQPQFTRQAMREQGPAESEAGGTESGIGVAEVEAEMGTPGAESSEPGSGVSEMGAKENAPEAEEG